MKAAVICEFNPFHNGHKFLLKKIKSDLHAEIICIMSGNFVQRGDIAITDKYARTRAALSNGADMVVELPTPYAVSSASTFAEGGVRIASSLGCDCLCFGAGSDIETLTALVSLMEQEDVKARIHSAMQNGSYYPKALASAAGEEYEEVLSEPNNILALEYIRACRKYGVRPLAFPREGVQHDAETPMDNIASGSYIRRCIENGKDHAPYSPMEIESPAFLSALEPIILYRLKTMTTEDCRKLAEVSEGLENRIIEIAKQYNSLEEITEHLKTKRYTMARIRRIMIYALLDITTENQHTPVPYIRVLGVKSGKTDLMQDAVLPLIVKTKADYAKLNYSAKEIFDIDIRAAELMNIARKGTPINEFSEGIIKV